MGSTPKKPKPTPEELALRRRQGIELDRKTEEENRRRKMIAFGRLGTRQLLSGSPLGILDEQIARRNVGGTRAGRSAGSAGATASTVTQTAPASTLPPGSGGTGLS